MINSIFKGEIDSIVTGRESDTRSYKNFLLL